MKELDTPHTDNSNQNFQIVAIGASAGGLAALKTFMQSLPKKTGMAFVIIQHLDPTHKSMMSDILGKETSLSVTDAKHNLKVTPDHIYVIPPDKYLTIEGGKLKLSKPEDRRGSRRAIDHFFRSLASDCGDRCAGIILSGSGSDGTAGLRAVKAAGGLSLVQTPETAQHHNMPQSAIDADVVDKVVKVEEMFDLLKQYVEHPLTLSIQQETSDVSMDESLEELAAILKTHENFNVRQYKPSTVQRRIIRRMSLTNCKDYANYLDILRQDEKERRLLTKDLLINVTDFFRDPEAFEVLEKKVIPEIFKDINKKEDIRVWVAGCASGEEAYSIAILLLETVASARRENKIKVFATDIDEYAIKIARKGIYPESITGEIPQKYMDKYFVRAENGHQYRIKNQVRDLISFAVQNVISDPPFNHMHLISCRNLLIYLNKEVQEKILNGFYFALEGASYLFLGSSETLGKNAELFKTISKKWRLYKKIPDQDDNKMLLRNLQQNQSFSSTKKPLSSTNTRKKPKKNPSRSDNMRKALLDNFLPPSVIVDEQGQILYNHGDWKDYLKIPTGEPRNDITQLIIPALRSRLRSALFKVKKSKQALSFHCKVPNENKKTAKQIVRIEIGPIENQEFIDGLAIGIMFYPEDKLDQKQTAVITQEDELNANQNLERELAETKEELQNTIEELETSSEELKASHEEALSTNEELQSANEELEASAEELRSLNEELSTVNAQLKEKIDALQRANDDVENFFTSTDLPTIFLNPDLKIQRYTPAAEQLLKMGPQDLNRSIETLGRDLVDENLIEECKAVLRSFQPIRKEVQSFDKRWYIRQISPYRTEDRRIEGVVLVFQEVTKIKNLSERATAREKQQSVVAQLGIMALSGADPKEVMDQAVRQVAHVLEADYCKVLKYQPADNNFLMVSGIGWQEGLVGKTTVPDDQNSQAGFTLNTQKPVIVKNLAKEKRFSGPSLLTEHQVVSGISCLINHTEPPFGVIGVHTKEERVFSEYDANFLVSVANMLSTAIKSKESQEQIAYSERKLRVAMESNNFGAFEYYLNKEHTEWDPLLCDIWGVGAKEQPTQDIFWEGVHPEDREMVKQKLQEASDKKHDSRYHAIYRVINRQNRELKWVEASGQTVFENGKATKMIGMIIDVTDIKQTQQQLSKSERKLRMAKDTNRIGVWEYNVQTGDLIWDNLLLEIWGFDKTEGVTIDMFFAGLHDDDKPIVQEKLNRASDPQGDGYYHALYRVINAKTAEISWIEASGQTIFKNDIPTEMVGMVIDITDQKNLEDVLQKAVLDLKDADNKKNQFLSILGHELRNPLASLSGSLEVLEMRTPAEDKIYSMMKHNVEIMARLLDDLLDLNRVSQNKLKLTLNSVCIKEILQSCVQGLKAHCQKKKQTIELKVDTPLYVNGDATRLEQIFSNLIINAHKYTPKGGKIEINAKAIDKTVKVSVHDTGSGLDKAVLNKIFDPFFQVTAKNKASSGLGIGLALAKQLAELHGGSIKAFSEGKNKGSTFIVKLPEMSMRKKQPDGPMTAINSKTISGLKVLLIEDNQDILLTTPILLESLGCEVQTAKTGKAGIKIAREFKPDAALIDIGLPDINGHHVAEKLRKDGYQGLMIAISGYSHKEAREKSKQVGFNHHLAKPAKIATISRLLARARQTDKSGSE